MLSYQTVAVKVNLSPTFFGLLPRSSDRSSFAFFVLGRAARGGVSWREHPWPPFRSSPFEGHADSIELRKTALERMGQSRSEDVSRSGTSWWLDNFVLLEKVHKLCEEFCGLRRKSKGRLVQRGPLISLVFKYFAPRWMKRGPASGIDMAAALHTNALG